MSASKGTVAVRAMYWFRTDLRLHDSPALNAALGLKPEVLYPVWTWDPEYVFAHRVGVNRYSFLIESMHEVSTALNTLNAKSKLHVVRGAPAAVLPALWRAWGITHLCFEKDTSAYARRRDAEVRLLAEDAGVDIVEVHGHSLYDPELVVLAHGGKATMSASAWKAAVKGLPSPGRPLPVPGTLPPPGDTSLPALSRSEHPVERSADVNAESRMAEVTCFESFTGPHKDFAIPTLEELGLPPPTTSICGGEAEALRRLDAYCVEKEKVVAFAKPKTSPAAFDPPDTTLLSPYLKFGCLGSREFLWRVRDTIDAWKKSSGSKGVKESTQPENLEGQLVFREMYYAAEYAQGATFAQIRGNSICRYIDWKLQNDYDRSGNLIVPRPMGDPLSEARFLAWREGRTGFPWIDAIMRQLRIEGWVHHLARHSVACFLTRGQCYISWERGAEVFDELLLDWDPASNPGNWMWLSCSAFYSTYYRVYGVQSFPLKWDKSGALVRKYCPELAKFPDKYIYVPHTAPLDVQKKAGCIIGQDYPAPMLDERVEKERCLLRIKAAYSLKLYGDHDSVLDGSAKARIEEAYAGQLDKFDSDNGAGGSGKRKVSAGDVGDHPARPIRAAKRAKGQDTLDKFVRKR